MSVTSLRKPAQQHGRRKFLNNVGANYIGTLLSAVLPLLTLPIYFNALGGDKWGLVAFVNFFVSTLSILDAGFSQALVKEFAYSSSAEAKGCERISNLLLGYERLYIGFALTVGLLALPFVDVITTRWLDLGSLPYENGLIAVYCAIAMFIVQFPGSIYRTVLSAMQEQVRLNQIQILFILLRQGGGVALVLHTGELTQYLIWQVFCSAAESVVTSKYAWRETGQARSSSCWDGLAMRSTLRFAAMMATSVLLGALTTMVDKFFITSRLPIAQLGYYSIASSVSFGFLRLSYPVFTAILPRIARLRNDLVATLKINLNLLLIALSALFVFGFMYWFFGRLALQMWMRSNEAVVGVFDILTLLLVSSALNVIYNIGYTNWVATGRSRIIFFINITGFFFALLVTPRAIDKFGLLGASSALIIYNLIGASVSLAWLFACFKKLRNKNSHQA